MLARKHEYDYEYYDEYAFQEKTTPVFEKKCNFSLRRKVVSLVVMTLMFAFYMVMRTDVLIQQGYELVAIKKQEVEIVKNIDFLNVNLAKAKSPERITALASKIGMVPADKSLYVSSKTKEEAPKKDKGNEIDTAWNKKH